MLDAMIDRDPQDVLPQLPDNAPDIGSFEAACAGLKIG